jgi:hypothetical protein
VISAALSIEGLMLSAAAPPRRGLSTRRLLAACPCQHQGAACPPSPLDLECLLQTDEPNRNLAIGRLARSEDDRLSGDRSVDTARSRGRSLRSGAVQAVSAKGKRDKQDARPTTIIFSPPSRVFLQPSSHRDWRVRSGNRDRHGTLSEGTVVRAWLDNLAEVFLRPSHDHREFGEQSAAFRGPFAPDDFEACAMTTTPRREVSAARRRLWSGWPLHPLRRRRRRCPNAASVGEVDYTGGISKCGDRRVRTLLYEAANVMLTRYKGQLKLKDWAFAIAKRSTMRKARVALARRLAIIMHAMLRDGTAFISA